jgi:DNA-binding SARP family transcriptional activator
VDPVDRRVRLSLLGGFHASLSGERIRLPLGAQRLLALIAVRDGGISRCAGAEELWPGSRRGRAAANLRAAISPCRRIGRAEVIEEFDGLMQLAEWVEVDVRELVREAHAVVDDAPPPDQGSSDEQLIQGLSQELLPGWHDDWLVVERERWDNVRLHALETLAQRLMRARRYLTAHEAALAAAVIDPLRESAHRIAMEIYISEGNAGCALKHYQRYRWLLQRELGVNPSQKMSQLVDGLTSV